MTDDPGVMGNLPRSRPGRRSEKRAAEVKPPKRASAKKTGAKQASARASSKPRTAAKPRAAQGASGRAKARPAAKSRPAAKTGAARAAAGSQRARSAAAGAEKAPPTSVTDERVEERQGQDPITAALRAGMAVGDAGVKVLAKIVQRLPRP